MTTDTVKLARAFGDLIRDDLTAAELHQLCTNTDGLNANDFRDANMIMLDAFKETFGREPTFMDDADNEDDIPLWNDAWSIAERASYDVRGFTAFQATAHRVPLTDAPDDVTCCYDYYTPEQKPSHVWMYQDGTWIAEHADGVFHLHIERSEYEGTDRAALERKLYDWLVEEGCVNDPCKRTYQQAYEQADELCRVVMALRPDLEPMSLDDWIAEHAEKLTEAELRLANAALAYHPVYNPDFKK
jgi:hypothetical protein